MNFYNDLGNFYKNPIAFIGSRSSKFICCSERAKTERMNSLLRAAFFPFHAYFLPMANRCLSVRMKSCPWEMAGEA